MSDQSLALVTGGNRGIGLETTIQLAERGLGVLMGVRGGRLDPAVGEALEARGVGALVSHVPLDVTDPESIGAMADLVAERHGHLDVLVNNAGISIDDGVPASEMKDDTLLATLQTNLLGCHRVTRALLPLLRKSSAARIVNVSSTLGSLSDASDPVSSYKDAICPAYRISKAALNAWTIALAAELRSEKAGPPIKVNAACPGWVRTRLGSDRAPDSVAEGADTPIWLATLPEDGPSGGFFRSRKRINW